ncbi:integrin alpha-M-like [Carcharodon carcharias]|uniref:integrin alpha-M-like n=1 Tax=Carcharodon carcharias TaxID=13397 RepID=UPI001B7F3F45|nr:integrin alpha-M-like [Carcharodon carcharias]
MPRTMAHALPVLLCLGAALWPVYSFNLETTNPKSFSQSVQSQFGYRVTQFKGSFNSLLVSAPTKTDSQQNQTGALYHCKYNEQRCQSINMPVINGEKNLGLSLATDKTKERNVLACVPRFSYECFTNTYINGYCNILSNSLVQTGRVPSKVPVCPKILIDIAFLIDGSGSVSQNDFQRMKSFIKAIMQRFSNENAQIALAQFSHITQIEFTFTSYNQAHKKESLVDKIKQIGWGTMTPAGIQFVADNIFTSGAGARNGANRIMITITDGQSQDKKFAAAIEAANKKNINRYCIGVGSSFTSYDEKKELETIASKKEYVFQVDNFSALDKIQKELQEKIFAIEGTGTSASSSSFQLEMAQEGFSSLITDEAFVLGAVGAYDWSGGLAEFTSGVRRFYNLTATASPDAKNAYLGYSVKEAMKGRERFYITGAPRYSHKGKVFIFAQSSLRDYRDHIDGKQIGSYFGSELCPVDLNGDRQTDLLLVGAPMYHSQENGGIVHIYRMENMGTVKEVSSLLGVQGELLGRFGSAIAQISDLNGDRLADVAIGAPLEDEHRGAVYIYHGTQDRIKPTYSQRIRSPGFHYGLKYFGQSIDGSMDVSGDGLTDIAVGALGKIFVFRSRPVMDVTITMTFNPTKIMLKDVDCPDNAIGPKIDAEICFTIRQLTKKISGTPSLDFSYEVNLDTGRKIERAELKSDAKGSFKLSKKICLKPKIQVQSCIQDFLNPIEVQVNYTGLGLSSGNSPAPVLRTGEEGISIGKLPFEKECGADNICKDQMVVHFSIVGAQFIVVGSYSTLTLEVTLENAGENSYFAKVTYRVPTGLTFRKTSIISASRRSHIECDDSKNSKYSTVGIVSCRVNQPILRTGTKVRFNTTFDVASDVVWKPMAEISINASSDNEQSITTKSFVSKTIGVKYEVNVIIKGIESTQYINFTTDMAEEKPVQHIYKVENVGPQSLPINITFQVPFKIGTGLTWEKLTVKSYDSEAKCRKREGTSQADGQQINSLNISQSCNISTCKAFICQIPQLRHNGKAVLSIQGVVTWSKPQQVHAQELRLVTHAEVGYDESKYIHVSQATNHFQQAMVATRVEIVEIPNMLPIIVGSSIGGLVLLAVVAGILYKAGFFKRGYKAKLEEDAGDDGPGGSPIDASAPEGDNA